MCLVASFSHHSRDHTDSRYILFLLMEILVVSEPSYFFVCVPCSLRVLTSPASRVCTLLIGHFDNLWWLGIHANGTFPGLDHITLRLWAGAEWLSGDTPPPLSPLTGPGMAQLRSKLARWEMRCGDGRRDSSSFMLLVILWIWGWAWKSALSKNLHCVKGSFKLYF